MGEWMGECMGGWMVVGELLMRGLMDGRMNEWKD